MQAEARERTALLELHSDAVLAHFMITFNLQKIHPPVCSSSLPAGS